MASTTEKLSKGALLLRIVGIGLLNILIDTLFLPHAAGWLVIDIFFYPIVFVAVAVGNGKQKESESNRTDSTVIRDGTESFREKSLPPVGYRGPFWNKPSDAYLERTAQAEYASGAQGRLFAFLMLLVFAALAIILLR